MTIPAIREVTLNVQLDTSAFDQAAQAFRKIGTDYPEKVAAFLDGMEESFSQICGVSITQTDCDVLVVLEPSQKLADFIKGVHC